MQELHGFAVLNGRQNTGPNAAKLSRRWGESKAGVQEKARRPGGRLQRLVRRCWRQSMMT